ncbi:MAG: M48 family metallopeptidase [Acidimicrobiia bacterium]|nr:M48 family metallopeptidase [Acidimicrobiia bacterium]
MLIIAFVLIVGVAALAFNFLIGYGPVGIVIAVVIATVFAFTSYWKSDQVALRLSRAVPADPDQYARLHNLVEGLCIAGGLPKPGVYIVDDPAPNAFATGRNPDNAAIAVTTGLLEKMNRVELEGVLAHELGHVKNYDILVSTLAVMLVGVVALLADIGLRFFIFGGARRRGGGGGGGQGGAILLILALVFIVLAPILARVMQAAVSRRRESLADVSAIELTRYPPGLISALEKLKADQGIVRSSSRATADRRSRSRSSSPTTRSRAGPRSSSGSSTRTRPSTNGSRRCASSEPSWPGRRDPPTIHPRRATRTYPHTTCWPGAGAWRVEPGPRDVPREASAWRRDRRSIRWSRWSWWVRCSSQGVAVAPQRGRARVRTRRRRPVAATTARPRAQRPARRRERRSPAFPWRTAPCSTGPPWSSRSTTTPRRARRRG